MTVSGVIILLYGGMIYGIFPEMVESNISWEAHLMGALAGIMLAIFFRKTKSKMFIGEYQHNLDEKGRLAMPVKFRAKMAGGAVVTKGLDNCLFIYPINEWNIFEEKLKATELSLEYQ